MLSYRHAFHAGNHADVLKHLTQMLLLEALVKKADKALCYIDTHAGPGGYSLTSTYADKNREYEQGASRLFRQQHMPEPLHRYQQLLRACNPRGELRYYPGSPAIARHLLGSGHRLQLIELHPADFERLKRWAEPDSRVQLEQLDGFARLPKLLPPTERRALVLIDPPYEVKKDYQIAVATLENSVRRFATGVYLLWYPLLARPEVDELRRRLCSKSWRWLSAELHVRGTCEGMYGSGVFVINPPWQVLEQLQDCLPALRELLAQDGAAQYQLLSHGLD